MQKEAGVSLYALHDYQISMVGTVLVVCHTTLLVLETLTRRQLLTDPVFFFPLGRLARDSRRKEPSSAIRAGSVHRKALLRRAPRHGR